MLKGMLAVVLLLGLTGLALGADLDEIRTRGKLVAATSGNLPPNTFVDSNNELTGYDIEVGRFIGKELGVEMDFQRLDWKGILPGLQTGRFDAVFSNVNITKERLGVFEYSIPYSRAAVVAVVRAGVQGVNGYKELAGKRVGAISGGNDGEIPARAIAKEYGDFASFKGYPGYAEMFTDMRAGRLDVIIAPDLAAGDYIRKNPGVAEIRGEPYQVRFVGVPLQKGTVKLKAAVDAAIRKMRNSGLLDQRAEHYFGISNFSKQLIDRLPDL
jgi:ABC-type amino acid transport substrate-binding protein